MSETIPGGAYLAADGKTWHDSDGKVLDKKQVAEAEALLADKAEQADAAEVEEQVRLAASRQVLMVSSDALSQPKASKSKASKPKEE
jgi:hypothetical protein